MSSSSHNVNYAQTLALKQAANWQCSSCGRLCRHQDESFENFATRTGNDIETVAAHPRRWTLHVTTVEMSAAGLTGKHAVLCGSCHRTYHNYQRWQQRQRQHHQQQERLGQLTLNDIRLPLTGLQLSLSESVTPYEIVNSLPPQRRLKSPKSNR